MSKEAYVTIETAKLLKEQGFGWECNQYYDGEDYFITSVSDNWNDDTVLVSIPTHQMVCRWLREEYGLHIYTEYDTKFKFWHYHIKHIPYGIVWSCGGYKSHEDALEAAIKFALERKYYLNRKG